jgi:hypothetical protein
VSSEVKANKLSPATGTALQISDSGDTTTIPSGATLDVSSATMTGFTIPSGQTLTVASGATIDASAGTATGFGKVLQTVSTSYATAETTTSTSYVDTSLTATITPASASNKILIWVSTSWMSVHASNPAAIARIYNSTDAAAIADTMMQNYDSAGGTIYQAAPLSMIGEDTGRSVATTYLLQQKAASAGRDSRVNNTYTGWIILMEVEA